MLKKERLASAAVLTAAVFCMVGVYSIGTWGEYYDTEGNYKKITINKSFGYIENHPAFDEYRSYIIPWKDRLNQIIMPYLSLRSVCDVNHFNRKSVVDGFNFMIRMDKEGKNQFYRFYTDEQIKKEPDKANTGIVYIPGKKNAPFAIVVPGGGMTCICAFSEGFPIAAKLHEEGYSVFILQYRVAPAKNSNLDKHIEEQSQKAIEDLATALRYILKNADLWHLNKDNYSTWGFSAGGQLCQMWGMDAEYGYKAYDLPMPSVSVLAYSGWLSGTSEEYKSEPPTFFSYTLNDKVIGQSHVRQIENHMLTLKQYGIETRKFVSNNARHGYGTGEGTDAKGWMEEAIRFWRDRTYE